MIMGRFPVILALLAVAGSSLQHLVYGQVVPGRGSFSINESRPLAKAARIIEATFSLPVAYEDAEYAHSDDMVDMTNSVYKQTHPEAKALIPRRGVLNFAVALPTVSTTAGSAATVAQHVLDLHTANGNAGQFKLLHVGDMLAIVPVAVRDSAGVMVSTQSPIEARISLPSLERDSKQAIDDFCKTVSLASGRTLLMARPPARGLVVTVGAGNEVARDVLVRIISGFQWKDPRHVAKLPRLTWSMLYDPGLKAYVLNIYQVRSESRAPNGLTVMTPVYR
jgi:hypothetical protein